jgi:hypothetical protein
VVSHFNSSGDIAVIADASYSLTRILFSIVRTIENYFLGSLGPGKMPARLLDGAVHDADDLRKEGPRPRASWPN